MSSSFSGASGFEINNSTFYQVNLGSIVYICVCCDPTARPALGVGLRLSDEDGIRVLPPYQQHYPVHDPATSPWPEITQPRQRQIMPIHFSSQSDYTSFTQVYPAPMPYTQSHFSPTYQEIVGPLQTPSSLWLQPPHHQVLPFGLLTPAFQGEQVTSELVQTPPAEVPSASCQPLLHRQHAEMTISLGQHSLRQDHTPPSTRIYPPPLTEIYPPPLLPPPLYHYPTVDPYAQHFLDEAQRRQFPY